ncbi:hypothetical protein HanPSC8_Chr02g0070281 [Helianthus annuus]|nr:hypothetical protein HanPSC8_Chr02g0070281 [Helianthus annuus]
MGYNVGSTTQGGVLVLAHETLDHTSTTDGSKALHHHVEHRLDTSSAVDKSKDHTTKSPSNPLNTHCPTFCWRFDHTHHSQHRYVQEQESGYELSNPSPVKGP